MSDTTPRSLKRHYDGYYAGGRQEQWRAVGAVDKAAALTSMWDRVADGRPQRVLDVGCGDGALAARLFQLGFFTEYVGIDVSSSGVERASARGIPGARFSVYDGDVLPHEEGAFDLVVMSHVVEHVPEPRRLLREGARVGRCVYVEVPLELTWRTSRDHVWTDTGHINLYNPTVIRHLLQSTGMRVVEQRTYAPSPEVMAFYRRRARLSYALKAGLLRAAPWLAVQVFTYHCGLLAFPAGDPPPVVPH